MAKEEMPRIASDSKNQVKKRRREKKNTYIAKSNLLRFSFSLPRLVPAKKGITNEVCYDRTGGSRRVQDGS